MASFLWGEKQCPMNPEASEGGKKTTDYVPPVSSAHRFDKEWAWKAIERRGESSVRLEAKRFIKGSRGIGGAPL